MAAEVGKQKEHLSGDTCDVTQIQDEDLLRKMWQTTEDFGRKKEIRARMYKLREQRLREFYTTGEVLKDVQSVDPGVAVSIREETPKRGGMHYRQLVVGELRGDIENTTSTQHIITTSSSSSSTTTQSCTDEKSTKQYEKSDSSTTFTSKLPRLTSSNTSHTTEQQSTADGTAQSNTKVERQVSNTDTKIMSELQKLDTYLSTTGVETPTPTSEKDIKNFEQDISTSKTLSNSRNAISDSIRENNAKIERFEFETNDDDGTRNKTIIQEYHLPGSESQPEVHSIMKHTESNWKNEEGTKNTVSRTSTSSYCMESQQRRISTEVSPSHETFARSLRSSPERRMYESCTSTQSSSKTSIDYAVGRKSPERSRLTGSPTRSPRPSSVEQKEKNSPRASPDKEMRMSSKIQAESVQIPTSDLGRFSPTRTIRDKPGNIRSSPERRTGLSSKKTTLEETTNKNVSNFSGRRLSQTSPTRQSPSRSSPTVSPTRDVANSRKSPVRRVSKSSRDTINLESELKSCETEELSSKKIKRTSLSREIKINDTDEIDINNTKPLSDNSGVSPTHINTSSNSANTRLNSSQGSKERRKLSSASTRANAKRAGTPGASPTASPTRQNEKELITQGEKECSDIEDINKEQKPQDMSDTSEEDEHTSTIKISKDVKDQTICNIENKVETISDVENTEDNLILNSTAISNKKTEEYLTTEEETIQNLVSPVEKQTKYGAHVTEENDFKASNLIQMFSKKCVDNESSDSYKMRPNTTTLNSTTNSLKLNSKDNKAVQQSSSVNKKETISFTNVEKESKANVRQDQTALDAHVLKSRDDSSRSLDINKPKEISEIENQLEMAPCETHSLQLTPEKSKKNSHQNRTSRRRSRDYISDEDTSGRESSTSPVRRDINRLQNTTKTKISSQSIENKKSLQRPTKLPVAASKPEATNDRCCAHKHETNKPWRQSPSSQSPHKKESSTPVSSPDRKPQSLGRRRPSSRSPSTSPDRPKVTQARTDGKSASEKVFVVSPSEKGKKLPTRSLEGNIEGSTSTPSKLCTSKLTVNVNKSSPSSSKVKLRTPTSPTKHTNLSSRPAGRLQSPTKPAITPSVKKTSPILTQRVDIVRKVQSSQVPSYARPTSRTAIDDNKSPAQRLARVQPLSSRTASNSVSRLPTSTKSRGETKPQPIRNDSEKNIGVKAAKCNSELKDPSTKTSVTSNTKITITKQNNTTQKSIVESNLKINKPSNRKQCNSQPAIKGSNKPTMDKNSEIANKQIESDDDLESTYSTEEDETVTELEEVRFSSHTVDDTEDEDFKARVTAHGASLKPTTDIILLRSSRESSPDASQRTPRYADHVSEPDTDTDMQQKREVTPLNVVVRQSKTEQITDLDESGEEVDPSLLSVADRVNRFLSPGDSQGITQQKKLPVLTEQSSPNLDSPSAVRRARAMFEKSIANSPIEAILNKQFIPDILSRPSIFDSTERRRSQSTQNEESSINLEESTPFINNVCERNETEVNKIIENNLRTADTSVLVKSMEQLEDNEEPRIFKKDLSQTDKSKFNCLTTNRTKSNSSIDTEKTISDLGRRSKSPKKESSKDESRENKKFVSTATLTRSKPDNVASTTEKPQATVKPTTQTISHKKTVLNEVEPKVQQKSSGKFGITLRQTTTTDVVVTKTETMKDVDLKRDSTIEGLVIEEINDINVLEVMLEKATDYDTRRRLRAQIREVRRLGSTLVTNRTSPSKPKQEKEEPVRRASNSSSPSRRTSDVTLRKSPTRATDTSRQSPSKTGDVSRLSPERRLSSPSKELTRKASGTILNKNKVSRDEQDGNCISGTLIRQTSKKFEDESRKSSVTSITTRDVSKSATFTRQSSSKKVVEDERRHSRDENNKFNTFTRTSSNNKMNHQSNVEQGLERRKSSKSEITIELETSEASTGSKTPSPRKPSLSSTTPREANPTDSVTSSYGIGPTDESGRPLFGLRALRRSQQQEPGSVVIEQQPTQDTTDIKEVKDSSGRPLFGLRAIKREGSPRASDQSPGGPRGHTSATPSVSEQEDSARPHTMPERAPSSGQLRDLVQRHEQQAARSSPGSNTSPSQKPRAKLRDSFITQENKVSTIKTSKEESLSRSTDRSNALRSIIQKHENNTENEQQSKLIRKDSSRIEKNSYVSSPTPDDNVRCSPSRTETESPLPPAETSSRRTSESTLPEQTRRPGILKKPRDSPERSSTVTSSTAVSTATINLRKVDEASVNKIIEETRRSSVSRSPADGSNSNSSDLESPRAVAKIAQRSNSSALDKCRTSPERGDYDEEKVITDEDGGETRIRKTHREQVDDSGNSKSFTRTTTVSQRSSPQHGGEQKFTSSTTKVSQRTSTRGGEQPSGKPDHSIARVGRSGSVKALQQRFQQAADAGSGISDSSPKTRSYQKAGLIFRTNSFQHTNGCGPDLTQGNRSKEGSPRRDEESEEDGVRRSTSETTTRTSVTMKLSGVTPTSSPKSFIGNETRVTGVQDILTRMREADHEEVAPGTSEDDREARALLNKFLGAQVLMQGMEPLIAAQSPSLVSQVERSRIVGSSSSKVSTTTDGDDLDNIWDERKLRQLLDASDDYDSRRKIRARLRVVMAENKVTSEVESQDCDASQVSGSDGVLNTVREHSESTVISSSDNSTRKEVHTKTSSVTSSMTSTSRVSKAAPPSKLQMSPFAKFKQLDEQNSSPSPSSPKTPGGSNVPLFKFTDAGLSRSASNVKEKLLYWCQVKTKEYKDLKIENFSTSWSNGLAFCALIHHFGPENFDYYALRPEQRRKNFELAFRVADEKFDIAPLLDVEDMVMMKKPDWKCVFTYVQSIYRRFKDELD